MIIRRVVRGVSIIGSLVFTLVGSLSSPIHAISNSPANAHVIPGTENKIGRFDTAQTPHVK